MPRERERIIRTLEEGTIEFLARPRVRTDEVDSIDDIQHVVMRLAPANGSRERVIIIGRKQLRDRFWAFVHTNPGERTELIGEGEYHLYEHDGHAHLAYELNHHVDESLRRGVRLDRSGGFIVTVMNPDPSVWGDDQPPIQEELFPELRDVAPHTPYPPELQARFEGRRYAKLDSVEFLDHPGAELVLISE